MTGGSYLSRPKPKPKPRKVRTMTRGRARGGLAGPHQGIHAVEIGSARGLCGVWPGEGSDGWVVSEHAVSCPRCRKKLDEQDHGRDNAGR